MKNIFLFLGFFSSLAFAANSKPEHFINSALLITNESKLFIGLSEVHEGGSDKSGIYIYDTTQKKGEWVPTSEAFSSEHIVGIFPSTIRGELFILSQTRKAGTAKPSLSIFDRSKKTFLIVNTELDCANILEATSQRRKLILKCGPDPHHTPKQATLEITANNMLPVTSDKDIEWLPSKPNSMSEAKALILKLPTEKIRMNAESLFK